MKIKMLHLIPLSLLFIVNLVLMVSSVDIWVDQKYGIDNMNCFQNTTMSCKSLGYIYKHIPKYETVENNITVIINGDYVLQKTLVMDQVLVNVSKITFVGNYSKITTTNSSDSNFIIGKKDSSVDYIISFKNLTFEDFGKNSTAVIVSWGSQLLEIKNSQFLKNKCSAINTIDTNILVTFSSFEDNLGNSINKGEVYGNHQNFPSGNNSAGGAIAVIFSKQTSTSAIFQNNIFRSNRAVTFSEKIIIDSSESSSIAFSHTGGGILFAFMRNSAYSKVLIQNNKFIANSASLGGGLSLTFHDTSGLNDVTIVDNLFLQNTGTICGGGFAIATWRQSTSNSILIKNTNFTYNAAQVGAGGRILLQSYQNMYTKIPALQTIILQKVLFHKNKAASASALHINYNLGTTRRPFTPIIFRNVTFSNHSTEIYKFALQGPSAFSGVLLSIRVDLEFQDDNYFLYNELESPVFISNCELYVKDKLQFFKNSVQTSGGGMTMADNSYLYLYPSSVLQFIDNYAPVQGGALCVQTVGFPDMVYKYNPSCFMQYVTEKGPMSPSEWKVILLSFNFIILKLSAMQL